MQEGRANEAAIPLTEVAYGIRFVAPDFGLVTFGQYYDVVRSDFPVTQAVPPIVTQTAPGTLELPPLPRVWLMAGSRLVQLQVDRFIYNWRRIPNDTSEYPGFDVLFPEFEKELRRFLDFANKNLQLPLELIELTLTYVNQIKPTDSLESPIFIFRENEWRKELPEPEFWLSQFRFLFDESNLKFAVTARPSIDTSVGRVLTTFEMSLSSIRKPATLNEAVRWYVSAHDKVRWAFSKLVRAEWLELWGFNRINA